MNLFLNNKLNNKAAEYYSFQKANLIIANSLRQEFGACVDLLPTISKIANLEIPESHKVDGQLLNNLFVGKPSAQQRDVFPQPLSTSSPREESLLYDMRK